MLRRNVCMAGLACAIAAALTGCDSLPSWMGGEEKEIVRLPGERFAALPVRSNIAAAPELAAVPVTLPQPVANAEWPQHSGLFTAAGSHLALSGKLERQESAATGEGEAFEHALVARPVVAAGMVFAMDGAGYVSAHDAADIGTVRWRSKGVAEKDEPQLFGGGLAYAEGRLFISSGRGLIVALDGATGKEIWRRATTIPFRSPPAIEGGRLFVISVDSQLYALNAANGEILWTHRGINETAGLLRSVSPVVASGTLIAPYASGELYALSVTDGREIWNAAIGGGSRTQASAIFSGIGGDPLVDGEVVIAVSSGGAMSVFNLWNGQRLWERPLSSIHTPWLSGDFVYVLTGDNTLAALVKYDGRARWVMQLPGFENEDKKKDPIHWSAPLLANGHLILVGSHGEAMLVSAADGKVAATLSIPDHVYTPPVVAGGVMYLVDKDARLHALR